MDKKNFNAEPTILRKPSIFYGWYLVAVGWMMTFLVSAVAVGLFFKPMLNEFGWDRATLSSVQTIALLIFAAVSPFLGRLIDRFGPRLILFFCIGSQALSSVVNGLSGSLWQLCVGRFLYQMQPSHPTQVVINRWFTKKRGRALGIVATGMPIGTLVLSPLSQYLINIWGWRATMGFWAAVTFAVLFPLTFLVRNRPEDAGYAVDGITAEIPDELSATEEIAQVNAQKSSILFVFKMSAFWLLGMSHFICGIACGFMMTHLVIFATDIGYSDMVGASLLSVQGGVNLIGVLVTGHSSDRYKRSKVLAITHLIRSLSFVAVVIFVLFGSSSLWFLYVAIALFGFGWYTTAPLAYGLVADLFNHRYMGTIIGLIMSTHILGMALGAYAGGITYVLTGSYFICLCAIGILEFLAALFVFAIKPAVHTDYQK